MNFRAVKEFLLEVAVFLKGINGILELAGAGILFFVKSHVLSVFFKNLFSHEISRDPDDFILNLLFHIFTTSGHGTRMFIAWYLFIHSLVNLFLSVTLWKKKLFAYPLAIVILSFFIAYQILRFAYTGSYVLLGITLLDMIIVYLVVDEYMRKRRI